MCLDSKLPLPKRPLKIGYKVLIKDRKTYRSPIMPLAQNRYRLGQWHNDPQSSPLYYRDSSEAYGTGYHLFTNKSAARSYHRYFMLRRDLVVCKVEIDQVTTLGLYCFAGRPYRCVVARRIKVLEEVS